MNVLCISDPLAKSWWASTARGYIYALMAHCNEARYLPILRTGVSPDNVEADFRPIMTRFGMGDPPEVVLFAGTAQQAAERIFEADMVGKARNVALVDLEGQRPTAQLIDGLSQYDEVWTPHWATARAGHMLREAGVNARGMLLPFYRALWDRMPMPGAHPWNLIFYAVGTWRELEAVVDCYRLEYTPEDKTLLHLECPDCPLPTGLQPTWPAITWNTDLAKNGHYWRGLALAGDALVMGRPRPDLDPWAFDAQVAGTPVLVLDGERKISELVAATVDGDVAADREIRRTAHDADVVGRHMLERLTAIVAGDTDTPVPVKAAEPPESTDPELPEMSASEQFERVETVPPLVEPVYCYRRDELAAHESHISVVIPHRNRGAEHFPRLLAALRPQLRAVDEIIVSDQQSDAGVFEELLQFCQVEKLKLVSCPKPESASWSIGACKNAGLQAATGELVVFLDLDLVPCPRYIDSLEYLFFKGKFDLVIPVCQEERTDNFRYASGCLLAPRPALLGVHGFDEAYQGWGSEDIDLCWRLERAGLKKAVSPEAISAHQPHEPDPHKFVFGPGNQARCQARMAGEDLGPVNPEGMTDYTVMHDPAEDGL